MAHRINDVPILASAIAVAPADAAERSLLGLNSQKASIQLSRQLQTLRARASAST